MKQANQFTRKEVSRIANEYAGSEGEYSASYFCEHYEATESTFYSVLKKAVVEGIVGMETAKRIAKKSAENSEEHGGKGGKVRSEKAYKHYFMLRKYFKFTKMEAIALAREYAESPMTVAEFCRKNFIAERKLFDQTLSNAITEGWVSDITVNKLRKKAVSLHGQRAEEFFNMLCDKRAERKAEKLDFERRKRKMKKEAVTEE